MCNPALVVAVGTTMATMVQQRSNQKAQLKIQKRADDREQERFRSQATADRIQESFEAEQRAKELEAASRKVREARATARTSAGESGVAGTSVDLLLDQYTRQGAALRLGLRRQAKQVEIARSFKLNDFQNQSAMNRIQINQPVAGIDYAGAIGTGISTYTGVNAAWKDYKASKGGA